jgi:preprotein translocase subunit SecE
VGLADSWNKITGFFTETRSELKKVTFPPRKEVVATTIVVLVASVVFAFYLWAADMVIVRLYELILRAFGK